MSETRPGNLLNRSFSLKSNFLANFSGNAFVSIVSLVLTPFYLRYIGVEAYGLVGFFTSIQFMMSLLDMGLGVTISRELAINHGNPEKVTDSRNLLRTLETVYWGVSILLGIILILISPALTRWVNPVQLSSETVATSFIIMGIGMALQFPVGFYSGALFGLEKHIILTICNVVFGTLRTFGSLFVLHFISPKPESFFIWQAAVSGGYVLSVAAMSWLTMPGKGQPARFEKKKLAGIAAFATGIGGIYFLNMLLTQADKIILSRILPLETFGYYALAGLIASGFGRITYPVFQAYFPKMTVLIGKEEQGSLIKTYHQGCQLMAVMVMPIGAMFIFFSREIIYAWQGKPDIVENTWLTAGLLVSGSALSALLTPPYALQLAYAWTKLHFYSLLCGVALLIPLTLFCAIKYGAIGAASVWLFINAAFILVEIPLMHRKLIPGELGKWYLQDFGAPLIASIATAWIGSILYIETTERWLAFLQLGTVFIICVITTLLAATFFRGRILNLLSGKIRI